MIKTIFIFDLTVYLFIKQILLSPYCALGITPNSRNMVVNKKENSVLGT